MRGICHNKKISLFAIFISVIHVGVPVWAFAADQGVPIDDVDRVRQELQPFVPLNRIFVLDPVRNEIILLFPEKEAEEITQPEKPETETEERVFPGTHLETETGTSTIRME